MDSACACGMQGTQYSSTSSLLYMVNLVTLSCSVTDVGH